MNQPVDLEVSEFLYSQWGWGGHLGVPRTAASLPFPPARSPGAVCPLYGGTAVRPSTATCLLSIPVSVKEGALAWWQKATPLVLQRSVCQTTVQTATQLTHPCVCAEPISQGGGGRRRRNQVYFNGTKVGSQYQ